MLNIYRFLLKTSFVLIACCCIFTSLATAQPNTVAEIEPNENGPQSTAIGLSPNTPVIVTGSISAPGDADVFGFTAPAGSRLWVTVDTGASTSSTDSIIRLYRAGNDTPIEVDDDDGTGNNGDSSVESDLASNIAGRRLTQGGTYYLRLEEFGNDQTLTNYRILFALTPDQTPTAESESNNTPETSNPIVTNNQPIGVASGLINQNGDLDFYRVRASKDDVIYFNLDADPQRNGTDFDAVLELQDAANNVLLTVNSSDTASTAPSSEGANFKVTANGTNTYYIVVRNSDANTSGNAQNYNLMVTNFRSIPTITGTKTASSTNSFTEGNPFTYTIVLSNNTTVNQGNNPGDEFVDQLPVGVQVVDATSTSGTTLVNFNTNTVTFNGAIAAGGSVTITITANINNGTGGQTISNQGQINYDSNGDGTNDKTRGTDDPTVTPNNSNDINPTTFVVTSGADLAITKAASPGVVTAGGATNITYTITVTNNGPSTANNVVVTDSQPAGTDYVSFTQNSGPAFTCNTNVTCTRASFTSGSSAVFTFVLSVPANSNADDISNTATVSSSTFDPNTANNSATTNTSIATSADLALTMTGTNSATAGGDLIYTIRVRNNGPSTARQVVLSDRIPSGTTFTSISGPNGWNCRAVTAGSRVTARCNRAALASGTEATFALRVKVNSFTGAGTVIQNTAEVTSNTSDPNPNNNAAVTSTTVTAGGGGN